MSGHIALYVPDASDVWRPLLITSYSTDDAISNGLPIAVKLNATCGLLWLHLCMRQHRESRPTTLRRCSACMVQQMSQHTMHSQSVHV